MDEDDCYSDELNTSDSDDSCEDERHKYERFRKKHLDFKNSSGAWNLIPLMILGKQFVSR